VSFLFWGREIFGLNYADGEVFFRVDPVTDSLVATEKTQHYTLMFHTFVFMQVFNEINARKLGDKEYNVFAGFFNNLLFLAIILVTIAVQCALVQYGGIPVRTCPLTMNQHLMCIGIGMYSIIHGFFVKALLPASWFSKW
jgi:Ca2+ transporting ATPase